MGVLQTSKKYLLTWQYMFALTSWGGVQIRTLKYNEKLTGGYKAVLRRG